MPFQVKPEIISHLNRDHRLKILIDHCKIDIHKGPITVYDDLIRSVVSQQLSTSAAASIYNRFISNMQGTKSIPTQIMGLSIEDLRSCGLSTQKAGYIKNITTHFLDNDLFDFAWEKLTDEQIIEELTKIKGVGKWTVEMILIFSMHREDVLPLDDLIIRNHMIKLYEVNTTGKQLFADLTSIAASWRPYRSYACMYLWAAKNTGWIK